MHGWAGEPVHAVGQVLLGVIIVCAGAGYVLHVAHEVGSVLPARARTRAAGMRSAVRGRIPKIPEPVRARMTTRPRFVRSVVGPALTDTVTGRPRQTLKDSLMDLKADRDEWKRTRTGKTLFQRVVIKGAPPLGMTHSPAAPREPLKLVKPAGPAPAATPVQRPVPSPVPARPVPTEVAPMTTNAATPGGAGADLFAAVQHIINHASAGGVRSKLRAITQFDEALGYEAGSLDGFAKRLAEPDQSYSSAVWEPVAMAAAHMRAAQMQMAEAGSALRHVMSVTVGEAASSGTRVPHHDQINSGQ